MATLAAANPSEAVLGWTGPTGAVHDFSRNGYDIEVKSPAAVNANTVRISNIDQFDPRLSTDLHLAVVHLSASTDAPDIETRIERLLAMGVPADALETRLGDAGYYRGMELSVPSDYTLRAIRWWNVDADFPGLRASDIDISRLVGIDGISYDLLLGVLPTAMSLTPRRRWHKLGRDERRDVQQLLDALRPVSRHHPPGDITTSSVLAAHLRAADIEPAGRAWELASAEFRSSGDFAHAVSAAQTERATPTGRRQPENGTPTESCDSATELIGARTSTGPMDWFPQRFEPGAIQGAGAKKLWAPRMCRRRNYSSARPRRTVGMPA